MAEAISVQCPSCETAFPVDPTKVPAGGVNARCSECSDIFRVEEPSTGAAGAPPSGAAPAGGEDPGQQAPQDAGAGEAEGQLDTVDFYFGGGAEEEPGAGGAAGPGAESGVGVEEPPPETGEEAAATGAEAETARPAFGQRTPEEKAQRLARVLVSDMITYNPQLYETALERGTLKEDFEEEIEKSWEEYVAQVGEDLASSTSHWKDALNDILAKGDEVF